MTWTRARSTTGLAAALHRWERVGRRSLPIDGFELVRLPGQARRGLYLAANHVPVLEPDGHILAWSAAPDRSSIAVQLAASADEDAALVIVDVASGTTIEFGDVRCRYDPMLWDRTSSRLSVVAEGSLVDVDVPGERVAGVDVLPVGRWRLFPGGEDGLLAHSRPGRPTTILDRSTKTEIAQARAVTTIVDCDGAAVYGDGRGLHAIAPASGRRLWDWCDPDITPTGIAVSGDRLLVAGVRAGRGVLAEVVSGVQIDEIDPEDSLGPVTVSAVAAAHDGFVVLVESFTRPPTPIRLDDVRGGRRPASPTSTRWLTVPADDGTDLSVAVAAPAGDDRPRPMILTCYGGFGQCALPEFEPTAAAWVESGRSYAVAQVRGGGERGAAWRAAGYGPRKRRGVDDLTCVARGLVESGLTTPDLLVLAGASHGGVLAASSAFGAPDTCAAVVATAAPLDLTRLDEHPLGHRWADEFGADGTVAGDARLASLSPLHRAGRLARADNVPAFLGIVLGEDTRVAADATRRVVDTLRDVGGDAELWRRDDAGHGGNHLDALHAMGARLLAFAADTTCEADA
ncbi:prolyl oligopeptidase family serine peptidase [Gordonia sp. MP11Mi]|uniref:prolyl oligopeptidase n=1 Tax=Gordonia sp. MP11Mi TaxID=3022769 RepID=A0AA97CYB3_9ACTN